MSAYQFGDFGGQYLRDTGPDGDANFYFLQLSYTPQ